MSKTIIPQQPTLGQTIGDLREIADTIMFGEVDPRWQVDHIARILARALEDLDARLARLEAYQAEIEWADTAFGAQQEGV